MNHSLSALILGFVEGLTEFIPVSSTGHLLIVESIIKDHRPEYFNIFIQCGAALALLPIFWRKLLDLFVNWRQPEQRDTLLKLAVAFLITAVGGIVLEKFGLKLPDDPAPVAWATIIGGVVIFALEGWSKLRFPTLRISWTVAIVFGVAQLLAAAYPGTSRSGATIMLAMAFGLARPQATEFSFLLGMPTLLAAGGYKLFKAWRDGEISDVSGADLVIGFAAAAAAAFVVVKWLLKFVQSHTFYGFAFYRLALGILILLFFRSAGTPRTETASLPTPPPAVVAAMTPDDTGRR